MKNSKSRRDDGMKNSSGEDSQSDKPKRTNAESSFKSYRENRSNDALAKKGFVKKTLTSSTSSNIESNNAGNESAETSARPKRIPGSKTGTFSRIGSGRPTSTFKGNSKEGSGNASGYKGPVSDRESTSFRGKSDSRSERPSSGNRETTSFKGKTDSRSKRPSSGNSSRNDQSNSRTPITRGAERARAPRRETTDRNDAPRDSRPFASRSIEERAASRSNNPYKGSRAEKTYLDSKSGRSRSYDFEDEPESRPIKRNAAITHYNKVEEKPLGFDKGAPKPKKNSKPAEGEFMARKPRAETGEGTFKERQKVRNQESSASAKEARPAKRLNADFDDYKNSSRVSTSASRPFEKSARPSKTAARVDQAAERYSKGLETAARQPERERIRQQQHRGRDVQLGCRTEH